MLSSTLKAEIWRAEIFPSIMVIQIFIWSLFLQLCSPTFFNIPGNPNKPIYSDETHEDLLNELAGKKDRVEEGKELFNIKNAVSTGITFEEFSTVEITEDRENGRLVSYTLSVSGDDKPPIQRVMSKMFGPNYNLQKVTSILDGNQILFEGGTVTKDAIVTLLGSQAKCSFNREIKLTNLNYAFSWRDRLSRRKDELGRRGGVLYNSRMTTVIKAKSEVNGDQIDVEIEKQENARVYTIKKYDPVETAGSIKIFEDFLEFFYPDVEPADLITEFDGVDTRKLREMSFDQKYRGFGWFSIDGSYQLCLQSAGVVEGVAAFDGANVDMKIIIHRVRNRRVNLAFVGKFTSEDKKIKDVVSYLTTNRDEKMFNRIKDKDYCLSMSAEQFELTVSDPSLERYEESFRDCYPIEFNEGTNKLKINQGLTTYVMLSLSDENNCIQEACKEESCQEQYEDSTIIGKITRTGVIWSSTKSNKIDMLRFLRCISKDDNMFDIPLDFLNPEQSRFVSIRDFYTEDGYLSICFRFTVPVKIPLVIIPNFYVKTIDFQYEQTDEAVYGSDEDEEEEDEDAADEDGGEAEGEEKSVVTNSTITRKANKRAPKRRRKAKKPISSGQPSSKKQPTGSSTSGSTSGSSSSGGATSSSSSSNNNNTASDESESSDSEDESESEETEEEEQGIKHEASITINGEGENEEQKNIFCKGEPFTKLRDFTCTLYIASMTIEDSIVALMGKENGKNIVENAAIKKTGILQTGLKNIEATYSTVNTKKFSLVAQISLGTFDRIAVECLYYSGYGTAFALSVKEINVEYILNLFFGFKVSLPWLRNLDAFVVVSSIDLEGLMEAEASEEEPEDENAEEEEEEARRRLIDGIHKKKGKSKFSLTKRAAWLKTLACHAQKEKTGKDCEKLLGNTKHKKRNFSKEGFKGSSVKPSIKKRKVPKRRRQNNVNKGKAKAKAKTQGANANQGKKKKAGNTQQNNGNSKTDKQNNDNKKEEKSSDNAESENDDEESDDESEEDEEEEDDEEEEEQDPRYQFSVSSIKHVSIGSGFKFGFKWKAPSYVEDCYDDSICKFIVQNTNRAQLRIGGSYTNTATNTSVFFYADLRMNVNLNEAKTMKLQGAQLQIRLGKTLEDNFILLSATLTYITDTTHLTFKGVISAALSGKLELQFTMSGFVYEPMGLQYFAFGDLYLGAKLSIEKGQFSFTLEIGATIAIGRIVREEGEQTHLAEGYLQITGMIGLDIVTIVNSWCYAEMTQLTFGMIASAFGQTFPEGFEEDGFHTGILFSYAPKPVTIHALNKKIDAGIHIAGGIKFAFLEATGDFRMNHQEGTIEVIIDFAPINLLGGLVVFTSLDDEEEGPHFYLNADLKNPKEIEFNINAKLTLFGISIGVEIKFNSKVLVIKTEITIFFFTARLELTMGLGKIVNGVNVKFKLKTEKTDFVDKLKQWIQESVTGIENDAREVEARKNATEQQVGAESGSANDTKSAWTTSIDDWNRELDNKTKELQQQAAKSAEQYNNCKNGCAEVCIPFFKWLDKCWKIWGHWVGCPKWDSCYTKIKDPICLLGCEVEHLKNSFLEFVQGALNKLEKAMTVVVKGLQGLVEAFTNAINALGEALTNLVNFVKKLVGNILIALIEAIDLNIEYLDLEADIRLRSRKCFYYGYKLSIFGTTHQYPPAGSNKKTERVCLDEILQYFVRKLFGIPARLKDHNKYYDEKDKADGMVESVNEAEKEVKKQKGKTDKQIKTEKNKEVVKKLNRNKKLPGHQFFKNVDELKKEHYHEYSEEELKVLNTPHRMKPYVKPAHLVKFIKEKAPWKMAQKIIDNPPNHEAIMATNQTHVKRSLIFGKHLSPCNRVKRSLKDYATLTNGLLQSIQHMEHAKVGMKNQKRDDINRLAAMYTKTHNLANEYDNYTPRQKRDIYYWYEHLRDGYQEHFRLTKRSYLEHQRDTLPKVKDSLDGLLGKNLGSSFESYTDELHRHAIDGFKRSNIPKPNDGESLLHGIKRNLTLIVTNEEFPLTHMKRHLLNVNQAIRDVNKHVMQC